MICTQCQYFDGSFVFSFVHSTFPDSSLHVYRSLISTLGKHRENFTRKIGFWEAEEHFARVRPHTLLYLEIKKISKHLLSPAKWHHSSKCHQWHNFCTSYFSCENCHFRRDFSRQLSLPSERNNGNLIIFTQRAQLVRTYSNDHLNS